MPIQREHRTTSPGECRQCSSFCDKLVQPRACMEMGCRFLYSYEDAFSGQRFFGCMNKVFRAEVDLDMFILTERSGGFGGIKMTGKPLPQCQFTVERAYEGEGPAYECVNRRFFDGPAEIEAFDLRNALI